MSRLPAIKKRRTNGIIELPRTYGNNTPETAATGEILPEVSDDLTLLAQPKDTTDIILTLLDVADVNVLMQTCHTLHSHVVECNMYIKRVLSNYAQSALITSDSMYRVSIFNRSIAATLFNSYEFFIKDGLKIMVQNNSNRSLYKNVTSVTKIHKINYMNLYDPSKKEYFEKLQQLFDKLQVYGNKVSIVFCPKTFNGLCIFKQTALFQVYSRLLSYSFMVEYPTEISNNQEYSLVNLYSKIRSLHGRALNYYERKLFRTFQFESGSDTLYDDNISSSIASKSEFLRRLDRTFCFNQWQYDIDWRRFWLVGGSLLQCLLTNDNNNSTQHQYHWNEKVDLDFFAVNITFEEYVYEINQFAKRCRSKGHTVLLQTVTSQKQCVQNLFVDFCGGENGNMSNLNRRIRRYSKEEIDTIFNRTKDIGNWQKFQFIWYDSKTKRALMNMIDLDCCQIGFDGRNQTVQCTHSFIQSIATNTFICYKLVQNSQDCTKILDRIAKYYRRGFTLLVPRQFNDTFLLNGIQLWKEQQKTNKSTNHENVNDNDNSIRNYTDFMLNNDTMAMRNTFIDLLKHQQISQ